MIATLRGIVTEKIDGIIIECGGVGYGVTMSTTDASTLPFQREVKLFIYEHIRDDAHTLFGFTSQDTKQLFEQLIGVKNVGPKVAMGILDIGSADSVRTAIAGGDMKMLQTAKGVGKRAAEQVIVELRDKVGVPVGDAAENLIHRSGINLSDEALHALVSLGYTEADAQSVLAQIDPSLSVEDRIKQALRGSR